MLISAGSLISFSIKGKTKAFSFSDDTSRTLVSGVPLPRDRIGATARGTRDRKRGLSVGAEERLRWQLSGHRGRLLRGHRPHVPRQSLGQLGVGHRIASRGETGLEARGTGFGAKLRLANDVRPGSRKASGSLPCRAWGHSSLQRSDRDGKATARGVAEGSLGDGPGDREGPSPPTVLRKGLFMGRCHAGL